MEVEALTAREDGLGYLIDLGSREDENDMGGRLLKSFEQGVPRVAGEHMHLVDDVYAVLGSGGSKGDLVDYRADIVDTAVGGCVHLDDIEYLSAVDAAAVLAYSAGIAVADIEAVDRLGEYLGAGGLARTARAREEIGMVHAVEAQLVAQSIGHVRLAVYVLKGLRPVLAVQNLICHDIPPFLRLRITRRSLWLLPNLQIDN